MSRIYFLGIKLATPEMRTLLYIFAGHYTRTPRCPHCRIPLYMNLWSNINFTPHPLLCCSFLGDFSFDALLWLSRDPEGPGAVLSRPEHHHYVGDPRARGCPSGGEPASAGSRLDIPLHNISWLYR